MDELVPATGRILRFWYGALAERCRLRFYEYLGGEPPEMAPESYPDAPPEWTNSEVWRKADDGHASTVVLDRSEPGLADLQAPEKRRRVKMRGPALDRPGQRRPGAVLAATFRCTRVRHSRKQPGISMIGSL